MIRMILHVDSVYLYKCGQVHIVMRKVILNMKSAMCQDWINCLSANPQNGQPHLNNSLGNGRRIFKCVLPFCGETMILTFWHMSKHS